MRKEIIIKEDLVIAWAADTMGALVITDVVPTEIFGKMIPEDEPMVGKTAADIGWTALGNTPIIADDRF